MLRVHNGEFKNNEVYYGVVNDKVIYGDLTHDRSEDAVVHIGCGYFSANFGLSEIFLFAPNGKEAILLASLNDNDIQRDYQRSYPGGITWRIIDEGVKVVKGDLVVKLYTEGAHCCPEYIATIRYRWNGSAFIQVGKIERKKIAANQSATGESDTRHDQGEGIQIGILKNKSPADCGCYFYPIVAGGKRDYDKFLFISDSTGKAWININGRNLELKEVGRKQAKGEYGYCAGKRCTYRDREVTVSIDFRVTRKCPPEPSGCEVTDYDAKISVEKDGIKKSVQSQGSCGC